VDLRLTGKVTREELMVAAKMMDCPLSAHDLEAMMEMFPSHALSRDGLVDYRLIQGLLQSYSPRQAGGFGSSSPHFLDQTFDLDPRLAQSKGALPAYASPGHTLTGAGQGFAGGRMLNKSISTPMGATLTTPFSPYDDSLSNRPGGIAHSNASRHLINGRASQNLMGETWNAPNATRTYELGIRGLLVRIRSALEEQRNRHGSEVSIRRQFEAYDNDGSGLVSSRTLQAVLDDIDIALTSADLQGMYHLYGRPEDDKIYYDEFCKAVENLGTVNSQRPGTAPGALSATVGGGGGGQGMDSFVPYLNARVLQRAQELFREGRGPRDMFEAADLDNSGLVTVHKFKDVVVKLQLLSTEHQLAKALEDYTNISNRSYVMYQDFCDALDRAVAGVETANIRSSTSSMRRSGPGFVYGSGFDGTTRSVMEQDGDEPTTVFGSLQKFRSENVHTPSHNVLHDYPNELEEGSEGFSPRGYPLSPPKVSDSLSIRPPRRGFQGDGIASWSNIGGGGSPQRFSVAGTPAGGGGYNSPGRFSRSVTYGDDSPRRSTSSIAPPRTSPSKVGSRMWGSHTPLNKKGQALRVGDDKWCCAVCLYVENSIHSATCAVCDSPNYNNNKVNLKAYIPCLLK
jgi:Ca2+-binding EF-hand superfamily protein